MHYFSKSKETCAHLWVQISQHREKEQEKKSSAPKSEGVHYTQSHPCKAYNLRVARYEHQKKHMLSQEFSICNIL